MSKKRKHNISFLDKDLEDINKEVGELEELTPYTSGSIKNANWALSLYSQFHEEMKIKDPLFPFKLDNFKPFLLELSKVYPYSTIQSVYLNLRRAYRISTGLKMELDNGEITKFFVLLRKNYGENIAKKDTSISVKRRPLIPRSVFTIVDSLDNSIIALRDKSILLTNMIIGQRTDSLQYVQLKHIEFLQFGDKEKKWAFKITIIKVLFVFLF